MELQKRPNGYYWVLHHGQWDIAKYDYTGESNWDWLIFGWEYPVPETDFEKVDERPLFYDHKLDRPVRKKKKYLRFTKNKKQ